MATGVAVNGVALPEGNQVPVVVGNHVVNVLRAAGAYGFAEGDLRLRKGEGRN
jgi:hypothetical protein